MNRTLDPILKAKRKFWDISFLCVLCVLCVEHPVLAKVKKIFRINLLLCVLCVLCVKHPVPAFAQTDLRAWNADGQTWIIWRDTYPLPFTWDVYASGAPIENLSGARLIGRLYPQDTHALRLKYSEGSANWRAPTGDGGYYTLTMYESLYVYTPHEAAPEYFAVVPHEQSDIGADSVVGPVEQSLDPVQCHRQYEGVTDTGRDFSVFAHWTDGREDYEDGRPDYPVMANAFASGIGHVFAVFEPDLGRTGEPMPAVLLLHGGAESNYYRFGIGDNPDLMIDTHVPDGFLVSVDDALYVLKDTGSGPVVDPDPTRWFGYWTNFNRFEIPTQSPPDDALVVDYTLRRIDFIVGWLVESGMADPARVSVEGLSGGGAGVGFFVRRRPDLFSAGIALVPTFQGTPFPFARFMQGRFNQNLRTNLPGGIGLSDFYFPTNALSDADLPILRYLIGISDDFMDWDGYLAAYNGMDSLRWGAQLYWDEREHVSLWDEGHWYEYGRLEPASLVRFRSDSSFPAFSATDSDTATPEREPVLSEDRYTSDPWGTWGGWCDFNETDIEDEPDRWAATIFLVSESDDARDIPDFDEMIADVSIRRPQAFRPDPETILAWTLTDLAGSAPDQSGFLAVPEDSPVTAFRLTLRKSPARLEFAVIPATDDDSDDDADDDSADDDSTDAENDDDEYVVEMDDDDDSESGCGC